MKREMWVDVVVTWAGVFGLVAGFVVVPVGLLGAMLGLIGLGLAVRERILKPTMNTDRTEIAPPSQETKLANGLLFVAKSIFVLMLVGWASFAMNADRSEIPPPSDETRLANGLLFVGKAIFLMLLVPWLGRAFVWLFPAGLKAFGR